MANTLATWAEKRAMLAAARSVEDEVRVDPYL
jgi:hypothetical protein